MKQPAPDVVVAGKYCLEGQLASGGMGSVWVARHIDLGVPVAIKFMGTDVAESEEGRIRFEREAKAAALLGSPHVVNVQDYGVDDGLAYIVMELLVGEDLEDRIYRMGRIPLDQVLTILVQTSKALRRAQDLGIVHRDIKPQNLFIAQSDDGDETVKVLDFGIAKETGPTLLAKGTNTGQIIGSPHYMSPEAVRGVRDIDHRSDLWSLGVITFQAVTGRLPFDSEIVGDVMGMILADPLPRATDVVPELPVELDDFFQRALARDRNQRFQSAREMTEAFAQVVNGPSSGSELWPASTRPPPVSTRSPSMSGDGARTPEPSGVAASTPPPSIATPDPSDATSAAKATELDPSSADAPVIASATAPAQSSAVSAGGGSRSRRRALVAAGALLVIGGVSVAVFKATSQPTSGAAPGVASQVPDTGAAPGAPGSTGTAAAVGAASPAAPEGPTKNTMSASSASAAGAGGAAGEDVASDKPSQASRQGGGKGAIAPAQKAPTGKKPKKTWGF